ncbi:MAG: hypothetical protein FWG10_13335 [Eubacteriaceae bacterium]|nr:hypothetical protein [Eubacteriaceae bacterium]
MYHMPIRRKTVDCGQKNVSDHNKKLWRQCAIPKDSEFNTKLEIASGIAKEVEKSRPLAFKQVGCSAASRATLQEGACYFADIDSSQRFSLRSQTGYCQSAKAAKRHWLNA